MTRRHLALELKAERVDVAAEGFGELGLADAVGVELGKEGGGEALLVRLRPAKVLLHSRRQLLLPLEVVDRPEHTGRGPALVGQAAAIHVKVELTLTCCLKSPFINLSHTQIYKNC